MSDNTSYEGASPTAITGTQATEALGHEVWETISSCSTSSLLTIILVGVGFYKLALPAMTRYVEALNNLTKAVEKLQDEKEHE